MKYILIFLTFFAFNCSSNEDLSGQEVKDRQELDKLKLEIINIADLSVCSEEFSCDFIGLGSKPCGGKWEYLVYSNSIDYVELIVKVKVYNDLEKKYNEKYNIVSDCMAVLPPDDVICENGKCKAVYN